jgi:hypothetical protein
VSAPGGSPLGRHDVRSLYAEQVLQRDRRMLQLGRVQVSLPVYPGVLPRGRGRA